MDYKLFQKSGLLLLQKDGKFSLFRGSYHESVTMLHQFEDIVDVSAVHMEEKAGLIFTSKGLFSIDGKKVSNFTGTEVKLIKLLGKQSYLIVSTNNSFSKDVLLWDGQQIKLDVGTEKYAVSTSFVAVTDNENWRIYNSNAEEIKLAYPIAKSDNLFLGNSLVVCGTAGKYRMYSLSNKSLLCDNKNLIICSPTKPFALCAEMSGKRLDAFCNNSWVTFDNVDNFLIVDDKLNLFALQKNGKYFIYNYNGMPEPVFATKYPNGVDFVASDNGILMVIKGEITDKMPVDFMEKVPSRRQTKK